jgi:hypothetical protein
MDSIVQLEYKVKGSTRITRVNVLLSSAKLFYFQFKDDPNITHWAIYLRPSAGLYTPIDLNNL